MRSWPRPSAVPVARTRRITLDHVARVARPGEGGGWRAQPTDDRPERFFPDRDHGSPGAALDAALAYRDGTPASAPQGKRRADASRSLVAGVLLTDVASRGETYPAVRAEVRVPDGTGATRRKTITRSVSRYGLDDALRQAVEFRFRHMKALHGDAFPYASADALLAEARAALPPEAGQ